MASEEQADLKLVVRDEKLSEIAQNNYLKLMINDRQYVLQSDNHSSSHQKMTLRLFLIPALIGTVLYYVFFHLRGQIFIQLLGRISIASVILIIGVSIGMITFALFFAYGKRKKFENLENIYWRNFLTILFSFTVIIILAMLFFFYLLGILFDGLVLDIYLSTLLSFVFFSIINYAMLSFVLILSPSLMTKLLVTVILGGVVIAMVTNSEAQWWQRNISFLGTQEASGAWQFNLTLILSALLMIALVDYLFVELKAFYPDHRGLVILRILLTVTAVSLGLVGYFPSDGPGQSPEYHNQAAAMLVYMVILMIIGVKWLVPKASNEFKLTSYIIGIILFVLTYLYLNGSYITLTGFEIVAFILAFSWLMLLLQSLDKAARVPIPTYLLEVEYIDEEI